MVVPAAGAFRAPQAREILGPNGHFLMKMTQKTAKVDQSGQADKSTRRLPTRALDDRRPRPAGPPAAAGASTAMLARRQHCCRAIGSPDGAATIRTSLHDALAVCTPHGRRLCTACPLCQLVPAAERRLMVTPFDCQKRQKCRNSMPSRHVHRKLPAPKRRRISRKAMYHLLFRFSMKP